VTGGRTLNRPAISVSEPIRWTRGGINGIKIQEGRIRTSPSPTRPFALCPFAHQDVPFAFAAPFAKNIVKTWSAHGESMVRAWCGHGAPHDVCAVLSRRAWRTHKEKGGPPAGEPPFDEPD